ncbi:MAG: ABC transporter permease [Armatimonadetes bacterium]|nr:ABC transporter permease [Armatimonadota bacterium]
MVVLVVRRLIALIPLLLGVTVVLFVLTHLLPADPVRVALGQDATPEQVRAYREELQLNTPLWQQYIRYVGNLIRGDFGKSIISRRPVVQDLRAFFPATLELTLTSIIFSSVVAIPLGISAAVNRGRWVDRLAQILSLFTASMPVFWFGVLLQIIFYARSGWLPAADRLDADLTPPATITGMYTFDSLVAGDTAVFFNALKHLVLPALVLSNINLAILARITRSSMLDVLGEGYVVTARAKGLSERRVLYRHALENALVPIITIAGMRFGDLMAGAILTETIFSWPGIGRYAVFSIERIDYPALIGFAVVATLLYALVNLGVDIMYAVIDPRMRP